jgi:glycine/D-amino acid oxidase-like deaminating enzyme
LEVVERKQGITTFASDGLYLIGHVPGIGNLFLATGCAAMEIAGSASIGRWLARWIIDGQPHEHFSVFRPGRFDVCGFDGAWLRREGIHFYANYYSIPSESGV